MGKSNTTQMKQNEMKEKQMADLIAALNGSHRLMWFFFRETKHVTNFCVAMNRQAMNCLAATSGNRLANCDGL